MMILNKSFISAIKKLAIAILTFSGIAHSVVTHASDYQQVNLLNKDIAYLGSLYVEKSESSVRFLRHSPATLTANEKRRGFNVNNAKTTTGISITFNTSSAKQKMVFKPLLEVNRGSNFAVYENGQFIRDYAFNRKDKEMVLEFDSITGNENSNFEVVLPSWSNPELISFEIQAGKSLLPLKSSNKPVYVALGDSITHGVGQKSASYLTYPFIFAKKADAQLYNLAVGGGKVSLATAEMLKEFPRIDLLTILVGYNDWNFNGKSADAFVNDYQALLAQIREHHPLTTIVVITPLFTKTIKSKKSGLSLKAFREGLSQLVAQLSSQGDKNLLLIHGEQITSENNLRADKPSDPVHLGIEGAQLFADALYQTILAFLTK